MVSTENLTQPVPLDLVELYCVMVSTENLTQLACHSVELHCIMVSTEKFNLATVYSRN